jgi:ribosomal protein L30E
MRLYYYVQTGHKRDLDRLKKATVLLKKLNERGLDTMLLVNDFRAGLVAREFGIAESVNIETIQDIDAIAKRDDAIIIDSPEDDRGRLEKYVYEFKEVFRFAQSCDDSSRYGENIIDYRDIIVDDIYFKEHKKDDRVLFFLGDSDADKTILSNSDFFKKAKMELLLGHYFYVKYENDLAKIFTKLHEAEEYIDLICSSGKVVTSSAQTAIEARIAGAKVIFIDNSNKTDCKKEILEDLEISIMSGFNIEEYKQIMLNEMSEYNLISKKSDNIALTIINKLIL